MSNSVERPAVQEMAPEREETKDNESESSSLVTVIIDERNDEERGAIEQEEEKVEEAPPVVDEAKTEKPLKQPAVTTYYPNVLNKKRMGNITLDSKAFLWEEIEATNNSGGSPARSRLLWRNVSQHEILSSAKVQDKHILRIIAKGGNVLHKKQKFFKFLDRETLIRIDQDMEKRMKDWADQAVEAAAAAGEAQLRGPTNVDENEAETVLGAIRFPFPQAFYDPVTWKLMLDPVVDPAGDSLENDGDLLLVNVSYYPNRALKSYIESELDIFADIISDKGGTGGGSPSLRGALMEWGHTMRFTLRNIMEKSALPTATGGAEEYTPLPEMFYCPISFDLIHEPVIDPDGYTYEKDAILHWLRNSSDSPMTRKPLREDQLRPNNAFLQVLEFLAEEHDDANEDAIHPSIRRWKVEHNHHATFPDIEEAGIAAAPASATDFTGVPTVPTAGSPRATIATPATTRTFASNREELEDMRHQSQNLSGSGKALTFGGIALAILVILFIPLAGGIGVVLLIMILLSIVPCILGSMTQHWQQQNTRPQTVEARRRSIAQNATMNNNGRGGRRSGYYQNQINQYQLDIQERQRRARQQLQALRQLDAERERRRRERMGQQRQW